MSQFRIGDRVLINANCMFLTIRGQLSKITHIYERPSQPFIRIQVESKPSSLADESWVVLEEDLILIPITATNEQVEALKLISK